MTAPDTNIEKQARRHRPSLLGISASIIFVAVLTIGGMAWLSQAPVAPDANTTVTPDQDNM